MYRVAIADDHPLFRSALNGALQELTDTCDVLEAENLDQAISLIEQQDIDLLLLDLKMPGNDGLMGLMRVRAEFPHLAVVVVSASEDAGTIHQIKSLGASGFIPKSSSIETITNGIASVFAGNVVFPDVMIVEVNETAEKLKLLTPKQFRVLQLIAQGALNKQIGYMLDIKETTVKSHISDIFKKLGINNRTQAALIIQEMSLVD
ncbi:MAG: response regulator transcription factor [Gammaproteobacteria bacterium]|nr:response regulator transcription factor [Gammaproteobacteria bacterium]